MIVTHTFLNKTNTIYKNSELNVGLNPICSLFYGKETSRALLDFDINNIKNLIKDKTYPDIKKLHHKLKMFNCSDVRIDSINLPFKSANAERTQSFDLILNKIPHSWDNGRGFDIEKEFYTDGKSSISTQGANWFNFRNELGRPIKEEEMNQEFMDTHHIKIMSGATELSFGDNLARLEHLPDVWADEYQDYYVVVIFDEKKGYDTYWQRIKCEFYEIHPNITVFESMWDIPGVVDLENNTDVIARQHFEYGNENLEMDVTDYINNCILNNEPNYGFLLSYDYLYELQKREFSQYVGFFSSKTNSFFQPYIETTYDDAIEDDRNNFILGKTNKIYFYASVGSNMTNLDKIPEAYINGSKMAVKQATKGVYYIEINPCDIKLEENTMYYDKWTNLYLNGKKINDIELYFTPKNSESFFNFGVPYESVEVPKFTPFIRGIKYNERMTQGLIRKLFVDCKIDYTANQTYQVDDLEYRLYVEVAEKEIDVVSWNKIDRTFNTNEITIKTDELVPARYHIDIKAKYNNEVGIYKNLLTFEIVSDYNK